MRDALLCLGIGAMLGGVLVGVVLLKANQSLTVEVGQMKFLVHTYADALREPGP